MPLVADNIGDGYTHSHRHIKFSDKRKPGEPVYKAIVILLGSWNL